MSSHSASEILAYLPRQRAKFDALLPRGESFDTEENARAFRKYDRFLRAQRCPYCRSRLQRVEKDGMVSNRGVRTTINFCGACGWWCCGRVDTPVGGEPDQDFSDETWGYAFLDSTLKKFRVDDLEIPVKVLRDYIYRNPMTLGSVHPRKFEELVASILRDFFDCKAILTGQSVDGGVDVYLIDGEHKYLVQVKRRAVLNSVESVQVIRELAGVLLISGHTRGMVVTTARDFSRMARREANSELMNARGYTIELVDARKFLDQLGVVKRKESFLPYWQSLLRKPFWEFYPQPIGIE